MGQVGSGVRIASWSIASWSTVVAVAGLQAAWYNKYAARMQGSTYFIRDSSGDGRYRWMDGRNTAVRLVGLTELVGSGDREPA